MLRINTAIIGSTEKMSGLLKNKDLWPCYNAELNKVVFMEVKKNTITNRAYKQLKRLVKIMGFKK